MKSYKRKEQVHNGKCQGDEESILSQSDYAYHIRRDTSRAHTELGSDGHHTYPKLILDDGKQEEKQVEMVGVNDECQTTAIFYGSALGVFYS